jgi:hypothetical protein
VAGIDPASFPIDPAGMTLPPDALLGLGAHETASRVLNQLAGCALPRYP